MPAQPADLAHIGTTIRTYRLVVGTNQQFFAQQIGITPRWLGEIENGRQRASELIYRRIAEVLGITYDELTAGPS